jgi:epoxyqueuosine reductase
MEYSTRKDLTVKVKDLAMSSGFDLVGICSADPPDHWAFYLDWLDKGYSGEMHYLNRNLERRSSLHEILPEAKSVVCVGLNYEPAQVDTRADDHARGLISRYARGEDYHEVMVEKLQRLFEQIQTQVPSAKGKVYVDTGPVLERDFAARAGLGWFGKHTNLIHKRKGSWFFLGEIILSLDLVVDAPVTDHCGTCTLCMEACPTEAIPEPFVIDSTRCISYLTIELKGPIPRDLRQGMGSWVYGCDICQEVCPWNIKHATPTEEPAFQAREGLENPVLSDLLMMDQQEFSKKFKGSPIKRTKRRGLLRNAAVALGNTKDPRGIPALSKALTDDEPLIRQHAAWALGRIGGDLASGILRDALDVEQDPDVLDEITQSLNDLVGTKSDSDS